jgi:hypothetical protein
VLFGLFQICGFFKPSTSKRSIMLHNESLKKREAVERNNAWNSLTPQQQLADLDRRLGVGIGAAKQRAKIQSRINAQ